MDSVLVSRSNAFAHLGCDTELAVHNDRRWYRNRKATLELFKALLVAHEGGLLNITLDHLMRMVVVVAVVLVLVAALAVAAWRCAAGSCGGVV